MKALAFIKLVLEAIIAIPKMLEMVNSSVEKVRFDALDKLKSDLKAELKEEIKLLSEAKTDEERINAIHSINRPR